MNRIRRSICFVVVALGAMLALPADAATKQFSISVTSTSTTSTLTFTNGASGGGTSSYINSVWFVPPYAVSNVKLQASLVTGNTAISPASCATSTGCAAGTQVQITYINGFGPGSSATITMNGSVPNASTSCTAPFNWTAQAFTGNALGGTNFVSPTGVTATAATTVSCTLQFLTKPANATAGANITSQVNTPKGTPVQVEALVNGAVASWFADTVTLTPSSGTLTGGTATASAGIASFGSPPGATALTLAAPGTYTLTASATGFTSVTSDPFKIFAGVLACGDPFASSFVNPFNISPDQPGYAAGMRNGYNKDGVSSQCVPVLYTFTNSILTSPYDQVQLSWDTASQPNAAFEYTMNWRLRPVVTSNPGNTTQPSPIGWPVTPRPGVAWLNTDGSTTSVAGTPAFVPGLACLSDKLPARYGTLASDVQTSDTTIKVEGIAANPAVPIPNTSPTAYYAVPVPGAPAVPSTPFPIVIANTVNGAQSTATERMTAASIVSVSPDPATVNPPIAPSYYTGTYAITYNVTRGTATEGFSAPAFHAAQVTTPGPNNGNDPNTYVMSTPLPIIPNDKTTFPAPYIVQTQAQMCIADHGFQAYGLAPAPTRASDPPAGTPLVMYTTTVIDIGDGYVKGSF